MQNQSVHPVIVLPPHTSFSSLAALITFMYSGEVNVFEDQITKLLELAETLGIKGLTEINSEHMVRIFIFCSFYIFFMCVLIFGKLNCSLCAGTQGICETNFLSA